MNVFLVICAIFNPVCIIYFLNKLYFKENNFSFFKYIISFSIYNGFIGWLIYFIIYLGLLNHYTILSLYLIFFLLSFFTFIKSKYYKNFALPKINNVSFHFLFLIFILLIIILGNFFESLAPLTNYDTLAYHLPIPFEIIDKNSFAVPDRALTGYQPLLSHMIFIQYLILGGEDLLRFFILICNGVFFLTTYHFFRLKLNSKYSLISTLILITIPIYIYSSSNGNIEILSLIFVMALLCYLNNFKFRSKYFYLVPALLIGFYASSKLFGLLLFGAFIVFLFIRKFNFYQIFGYIIVFLVVSFQWYFFIFIKTGSPFFPIFYDLLGISDLSFWDINQNEYFKNQIYDLNKKGLFKLLNFFIYPINLLIFPIDSYGGIKLSYGFIFLFSLPIIIYTLRKNIHSIFSNDYFLISILFYILWYIAGSTLFFRYLMPVFIPLIIINFTWYINKLLELNYKFLLYFSLYVTLFLHFTLFSLNNFNYFKYIINNESDMSFYQRNVPYFDAINWTNNNIPDGTNILSDIRAFRYLSNKNIFVIQPLLQNKINISTNLNNSEKFYNQIRTLDIEYIISKDNLNLDSGLKKNSTYNHHVTNLFINDCIKLIKKLKVNDFGSRAINAFVEKKDNFIINIYKLNSLNCNIKID